MKIKDLSLTERELGALKTYASAGPESDVVVIKARCDGQLKLIADLKSARLKLKVALEEKGITQPPVQPTLKSDSKSINVIRSVSKYNYNK